MITVRLFVDGQDRSWALVKCEACRAVCQFSALEAFGAPVRCKCGRQMIVRDLLVTAVGNNPKASPAMAVQYRNACLGQSAAAFAA